MADISQSRMHNGAVWLSVIYCVRCVLIVKVHDEGFSFGACKYKY